VEAQSIAQQPDARRELRSHLHGMWSAVAESWGEHADYTEARAAEATARLLELAAPAPGDRVVELACGAGGTGIAAAARVAPGGEVVLSDVAPEMTAIAARRAAAAGVDNVTARALDLEEIDEPDATFDAVLCREGLMFTTDPARACEEIARVLKPGGRFAIAVWGARAQNPWLGLVMDAVGAQLGRPVPPPAMPGPFALDDAGRLEGLLTAAGLREVAVEELAVPLRTPSVDAWWERTSALAGPLQKILAAMPPEAIDAIKTRLRESAAPYATDDGALEFPGLTLIASGCR
jgi:SAM-dependent methyltransferase